MKVHELLTDETKWCKGDLALDSNKKPVSPTDESAVCWCMLGAMCRCYPDKLDKVHDLLSKHLHLSRISISHFNDDCTNFEKVRQIFLDLDI